MKTTDELRAELEQLEADMAGYLGVVDDSRAVVAAFKKSREALEAELREAGRRE